MKKVVLFVLGLVLVGAGCGSPATSGNTTTTTTTNSSAVDQSIRAKEKEINQAARSDGHDVLAENGIATSGGLDIQYGDVTNDNKEEAIVFLPSGGTQTGIVALLIYGYDNGKAHLLQRIDGNRMDARASNGDLLVYEHDPDAAFSQVTQEVYVWNGSKFEMKSSEDMTLPDD